MNGVINCGHRAGNEGGYWYIHIFLVTMHQRGHPISGRTSVLLFSFYFSSDPVPPPHKMTLVFRYGPVYNHLITMIQNGETNHARAV